MPSKNYEATWQMIRAIIDMKFLGDLPEIRNSAPVP